MVQGSLYSDQWSAFYWLAIAARRADVVALSMEGVRYRIHIWPKLNSDVLEILHRLETLVIITYGKISKTNLPDDDLTQLRAELREAFSFKV